MKILFLLIFLLEVLIARENPFEPLFSTPKANLDIIPLLHITTNEAATPTQKILAKKQPVLKPVIIKTPTIDKPSIETQTITPSIMIVKKPAMIKKKKTKVIKRKYKTIYQNYFLKVQTNYKNFKIFTSDKLLKKVRYTNPSRMTFDFERLQYFHTKNITFNKPFAKKIKLGSHHDFYRITIELNRYKHYKLIKKSYGYLLTFH